jgi:ribosomal protein S18 acetylase RimI-like enzyme
LRVDALTAEDWQRFRALRLAALRDAPYAFGSTLAEWTGEGDREERWRARLTEVPFNLIAELDGNPAGMVSATPPDADGMVLLISMWVAPFARGRGVGDALVDAVTTWARQQGAAGVMLAVRVTNPHATALYRRRQFVDEGPIERASADQPLEHRMTIRL